MQWMDTTASKCRYGNVASELFRDSTVIWECSEADYQGYANVLARLEDGTYLLYGWTYGSCGGCDSWEAADMSREDIESEMRRGSRVMTHKALRSWAAMCRKEWKGEEPYYKTGILHAIEQELEFVDPQPKPVFNNSLQLQLQKLALA